MNNIAAGEWNTAGNQVVRQSLNDATTETLKTTVEFSDFWKNVIQACECSSFEIYKILSIGRSAFHKNNKRIINVRRLRFVYPLGHLILQCFFSIFFFFTFYNQALSNFHHFPQGIVLSHFKFRNKTGKWLHWKDKCVKKGWVIGHDTTTFSPPIVVWFPFWA